MGEHLKKAVELRAATDRHYNCAQSVLVPFAKECGLDEEQAYRVGANFGGGMKIGSVCGTLTGGLMVLGLLGEDDPTLVNKYFEIFKSKHGGCINCADLLRINEEAGGEKKAHCDGLVYDIVEAIESILPDK